MQELHSNHRQSGLHPLYVCTLELERKKQKIAKEEKSIGVWENEVKGRKRGTFTEEKKRVM